MTSKAPTEAPNATADTPINNPVYTESVLSARPLFEATFAPTLCGPSWRVFKTAPGVAALELKYVLNQGDVGLVVDMQHANLWSLTTEPPGALGEGEDENVLSAEGG